jgi:putative ABC transport system permease protein
MRAPDLIGFAFNAIIRHRLRAGLLLLAMAIGVASVTLLTALGVGARRYVTDQFSALGTNLLIILPGRSETTGGAPPVLAETPRDLTLGDAMALTRSRYVRRMAPLIVGEAVVSFGGRERELTVLGSTADFQRVRQLDMAQGKFLPAVDPDKAVPVCVLGGKARDELFGAEPALGRWLRIGDRRFRVIGLLAPRGQSLGADLDDVAIVPVASAQLLYNRASLFRVLVEIKRREDSERARQAMLDIIRVRHEGEDDVTILTQDALLATFDNLLLALTLALGGIASVSLVVAGILIMNVTLVSVTQRTSEIGLLKALGARSATIRAVFLTEAAILGLFGAGVGLLLGQLGVWGGRALYPDFPLMVPPWAMFAAAGVAVGASLLFALLPARRAARLDPVEALAGR